LGNQYKQPVGSKLHFLKKSSLISLFLSIFIFLVCLLSDIKSPKMIPVFHAKIVFALKGQRNSGELIVESGELRKRSSEGNKLREPLKIHFFTTTFYEKSFVPNVPLVPNVSQKRTLGTIGTNGTNNQLIN
jgi:hypothetical protein